MNEFILNDEQEGCEVCGSINEDGCPFCKPCDGCYVPGSEECDFCKHSEECTLI